MLMENPEKIDFFFNHIGIQQCILNAESVVVYDSTVALS
jgi:hypothetical protein